jgi:hypothetical protein
MVVFAMANIRLVQFQRGDNQLFEILIVTALPAELISCSDEFENVDALAAHHHSRSAFANDVRCEAHRLG